MPYRVYEGVCALMVRAEVGPGRTDSRRYGRRMPPHMIDQRRVFYIGVYRPSFKANGIVDGTCEATCM